MGNGGNGLIPASNDPVFIRHMKLNGDPAGSLDMAVDGSVTPQDFFLEAGPEEKLIISRMIIHMKDSGSFDSGGFGNGPALTNGIVFWSRIIADGAPFDQDFTNGVPIQTNPDWGRYAYDVRIDSYGSGDQTLTCRFSLNRINPAGVILNEGERLGVRIADDLTGLNLMSIQIQGVIQGNPDMRWITPLTPPST